MRVLLCLLFVLSLAACGSAAKKDAADESKSEAKKEMAKSENVRVSECKSNSDIRVIEVKESDSDGFEVVYTKFGEAKSIASGSREHAEKIRDRVKTNLENAGFTCS